MSLKTFLQKAGSDLLKAVTFGADGAKDIAPLVSIANPELGALISTTATAVIAAEAAGTSAVGSAASAANGPQKLALAITAIEPQAIAFAKSIGVQQPTQAQMQTWVSGIVAALNAFEVSEA